MNVKPDAIITCPACGQAWTATMPLDACQWSLPCPVCEALLRPKPGDCCVFCSYGNTPCPPIQLKRPCYTGVCRGQG
ncbi:MAG: GDCCVxC domain-containing (seleno)protein [Halothiobacillaceae bacterium]